MKTFADLQFKPNPTAVIGGIQACMTFDNGYSVSVIRNAYSYGGRDNLYELAMMNADYSKIIYCDIVNYDVCGYLKPKDVTELMIKIQRVKPNAYPKDDKGE